MKVKLVILVATATLAIGAIVSPALGGGAKTVGVQDNFFSPRTLSVSKGTTVAWRWHGSNRHNVVVKNGPAKFRSKLTRSGSYKHKLTKTGTYQIVCTIHERTDQMRMTVTVR